MHKVRNFIKLIAKKNKHILYYSSKAIKINIFANQQYSISDILI